MMHGSRGKNSLKMLGSLRGEGVLKAAGGECPVTYHLDRYEGRQGRTATGEVDGALGAITGLEEAPTATLVLSTGVELAVGLSNIEADSADVDAQDASALG